MHKKTLLSWILIILGILVLIYIHYSGLTNIRTPDRVGAAFFPRTVLIIMIISLAIPLYTDRNENNSKLKKYVLNYEEIIKLISYSISIIIYIFCMVYWFIYFNLCIHVGIIIYFWYKFQEGFLYIIICCYFNIYFYEFCRSIFSNKLSFLNQKNILSIKFIYLR